VGENKRTYNFYVQHRTISKIGLFGERGGEGESPWEGGNSKVFPAKKTGGCLQKLSEKFLLQVKKQRGNPEKKGVSQIFEGTGGLGKRSELGGQVASLSYPGKKF